MRQERLGLAGGADPVDPHELLADVASVGGAEIPFRAEMEAAFSEDFSTVRAFFGERARLAGIEARAAAAGEVVVFGDESPDKETVAHELAHVVQQRVGGGGGTGMSQPGGAAEREAADVGGAV